MKTLCTLLAVAAAVVAASSTAVSAAGAGIGPDRCVPVDLPGPEICTFDFTVHTVYPAGTRCAFEVTVHHVMTETIFFFEDPDRAVAHIVSEGTATGNGNTLRRVARFTETASAPFVLTDRGLIARYSFPNGGVVAVWAGYQQTSIDPPLPTTFHGNPFDAEDDAAFCAALA